MYFPSHPPTAMTRLSGERAREALPICLVEWEETMSFVEGSGLAGDFESIWKTVESAGEASGNCYDLCRPGQLPTN